MVTLLYYQIPDALLGSSDEWHPKFNYFQPVAAHSTVTCGIHGSTLHPDDAEVFMSQLAVYKYC
ncbi:hypothetical protein SEPCBS119000_002894 [Sporothrix epigloea]|uniref:Uncharacterized protein n=1 Tax=Sporothrix epigloea TaxID=1892477 RepID=A0ABP0DIQ1_9PEZI